MCKHYKKPNLLALSTLVPYSLLPAPYLEYTINIV